MTTLQMSDRLAKAIRRDAKEYGYASPTAFLDELVRAEERRRAGARVAALVKEGFDGPTVPDNEAMWTEMEETIAKAAAKSKRRK